MAESEFTLLGQHLKQALQKESRGLTGVHDLYAMLVDGATQQRDVAALQDYIPSLEEIAASLDHSLYLAIAHRAWGVLYLLRGEYTQAEARLNQALELFQELETRWQIGRTFYELADLAQSRGESALARDNYSRALVTFEDIEALPDMARTQAAMGDLD